MWVAHGLLGTSAIGMAASVAAAHFLAGPFATTVAIHAFEGAIIGGICDWYALAKTYGSAVARRTEVADGIRDWIATELLDPKALTEELTRLAKSQEVRNAFYLWVDQQLDTPTQTQRQLEEFSKRIEGVVVDYVSRYRLSATDLDVVQQLLDNDALKNNMLKCLAGAVGEIARDPTLDQKLHELLNLHALVVLFGGNRLAVAKAREMLLEIERGLAIGAKGTALDTFLPLLNKGTAAFVRTWNALDEPERRRGATAMIELLRAPVLHALAVLLCEQRDQLRRLESLIEDPRVKTALSWVSKNLKEDLMRDVSAKMTEPLVRQSPADFRRMLERNTRVYLESIRINGTVLGFVLGGGLGALLQLFGV